MSSRFHNKFHRHNHHTNPSNDPRYPDSSHDPIASPDAPFQGDFVLQGSLSSSGGAIFNPSSPLSANIVFTGQMYQSSFTNPVTASGDFLLVKINDIQRAIRLWNYL